MRPIEVLSMLQAVVGNKRVVIISLLLAVLIAPLTLVSVSYAMVAPYDKYIISLQGTAGYASEHDLAMKDVTVGLVLGAGITREGKPFRELQSRLDSAAQAIERGDVNKLILSGDNRFHTYNEPLAMKNYLNNVKGISADKLQPDYAGRSTYESCERAAKVFQLDNVMLFSAESHLPRAIFLCRQFGINTYSVASTAEANNHKRREAMARVKAVLNVYIKGEDTILGQPITL